MDNNVQVIHPALLEWFLKDHDNEDRSYDADSALSSINK